MITRLKILRSEKGLTQQEVANMLNITKSAYTFWETGDRVPDIEGMIFLAKYYGVTLDYLYCQSDLRNNIVDDVELEQYLQHCIVGYNQFIKKS